MKDRMSCEFFSDGTLTLRSGNRDLLERQPVLRIIAGGKMYLPEKSEISENQLTLTFPTGNVVTEIADKEKYIRIKITDIPDGTDTVVFGPYLTKMERYGGLVGSAWDDECSVCIQSLNPKTIGGFPDRDKELHPYFGKDRLPKISRDSITGSAAVPVEDGVVLQCYAHDMSRPEIHDGGFSSVLSGAADKDGAEACVVLGDDAYIPGAAIALIACPRDELLDIIGDMEIAEGLPHPTIDGVWAKKSPRSSESYMMIWEDKNSYSYEETLDLVKKAGLHCIYSWCPFVSWGHFEIDPARFPGGDEGLKKAVSQAAERDLTFGFHTLSNFIHTYDPYVSPIPSPHLLVMDTTSLVSDIGAYDDKMIVAERKNYHVRTNLNAIRIEDELIQFTSCSETDGGWLIGGLTRGAFGTKAACHRGGEKVFRLQDHGYMTLFPDLFMQKEMAKRIGELIKKTGVRRMSFDGMEGCTFTGRGEYACSEYVRQVFETAGSELLCDASTSSHYRWHAHTYFNWGEPYYDWQGRGGMFRYRIHNQDYFSDNMMNHMLGQYTIRLSSDKFEATHPENFEFMLSQTVANNAGLGLDVGAAVLKNYGLTDYLLGLVKMWEDMRFNGEIPDALRRDMKDENANWHIEGTDSGWKVYRLRLQTYDFGYRTAKPCAPADHAELLMIDRAVPASDLNVRIRVGQKRNNGKMTYLAFHHGWGGFYPVLRFSGFEANAGDYLIYTGGTSIKHYDPDYHLIETIEGEGEGIIASGEIFGVDVHYALTEGSDIEPFATVFQAVETTDIKKKSDSNTL